MRFGCGVFFVVGRFVGVLCLSVVLIGWGFFGLFEGCWGCRCLRCWFFFWEGVSWWGGCGFWGVGVVVCRVSGVLGLLFFVDWGCCRVGGFGCVGVWLVGGGFRGVFWCLVGVVLGGGWVGMRCVGVEWGFAVFVGSCFGVFWVESVWYGVVLLVGDFRVMVVVFGGGWCGWVGL